MSARLVVNAKGDGSYSKSGELAGKRGVHPGTSFSCNRCKIRHASVSGRSTSRFSVLMNSGRDDF